MEAASLKAQGSFLTVAVSVQNVRQYLTESYATHNGQNNHLCGGRESEGVSCFVVQAS